jgi:hypothetical protein
LDHQAQILHRQIGLRSAGNQELKVEQTMNAQELIDMARTLVAGDNGLLAMDESNPTCNERFARLGIGDPARLSGVDCDHVRSR